MSCLLHNTALHALGCRFCCWLTWPSPCEVHGCLGSCGQAGSALLLVARLLKCSQVMSAGQCSLLASASLGFRSFQVLGFGGNSPSWCRRAAQGQLLAETALSPAQWDLLNTIRCSGETLLTLISDILDFSRIEASARPFPAAMAGSLQLTLGLIVHRG